MGGWVRLSFAVVIVLCAVSSSRRSLVLAETQRVSSVGQSSQFINSSFA